MVEQYRAATTIRPPYDGDDEGRSAALLWFRPIIGPGEKAAISESFFVKTDLSDVPGNCKTSNCTFEQDTTISVCLTPWEDVSSSVVKVCTNEKDVEDENLISCTVSIQPPGTLLPLSVGPGKKEHVE